MPPGSPRIPWLRAATARLRFVAVFAAVGLVLGGWETLRTYWARLTRPAASAPTAASSATEYFCPMDPGVLSDWPSKCPVCNMALILRARGEAVPLPTGVMSRMQLSPERLLLGGVETAAVDYAPLAREVELPGVVTASSTVEVDLFDRERGWVAVGQAATVGDGATGVVKLLEGHRAAIQLDGSRTIGDRVIARVRCPIAAREPFRSQPDTPPPLVPNEPRRLYICMTHADVLSLAAGPCPVDRSPLMARPLRADQRIRWWCPMHPAVVADRAGATCAECGGMTLAPRVVSYRPPGKVLAVPASAVIDDGSRSLVYVERAPGMFDGRSVVLGPRCEGFFPVVSGLEPGERVAARGAFLLDAETRLNPSTAAAYFGAGRSPSPPEPPKNAPDTWADALPTADRDAATRQRLCPVTGKPLGSMGVPPRVDIRGRAVYLCCEGCLPAIHADPAKYLSKLPGVSP